MQALETLEIDTAKAADSSVIWLHGLGADGHDFAPVVEMLGLPSTRFILPHAPRRAVTLNHGYIMPAWYDLYGLDATSKQDVAGIRQSRAQIDALIDQEMARGVPTERIVLAGFSQGGAIALHTALRRPARLAGIIALSTYLPLRSSLTEEASDANANIPIFMAHGTFDEVIRLETCLLSRDALKLHHYALEWHEYPMAHTVCEPEILDIRQFLCSVLQLDGR